MARLTDARVAALKSPTAGQAEYPDDLVVGLRFRIGSGGRKLDTIRRADVHELIESIECEVSPNRNLTLVRTLLGAVSRDWIEASPAEAIAKPKSESPRDRFLEMDEVRRVYIGANCLGILSVVSSKCSCSQCSAGLRWRRFAGTRLIWAPGLE